MPANHARPGHCPDDARGSQREGEQVEHDHAAQVEPAQRCKTDDQHHQHGAAQEAQHVVGEHALAPQQANQADAEGDLAG